MGFLDKLKGASKNILEQTGEVIAKGVENYIENSKKSEPKPEPEPVVEEPAISPEQEKAERIAKILEPTCENGDCLWCNERFYFNCPLDFECERKKYTKQNWGAELADERLWKYMKRVEKLGEYDSRKEIYEDFMVEFLPEYGPSMWGIADETFYLGFDKNNPYVDIVLALQKMPKIKDIISKLQILHRECSNRTVAHEVFKNKSLYEREIEDFEYTVKIFEIVLTQRKLEKFLIDTSVASIDQLIDEDGNVKQAW